MKKIALIILSTFLISCENEPVNFSSTNNNPNYSAALDTLKNYDDYILGDFNGKFLVSTDVYTRSYGATIVSSAVDSSFIQFQLAYKLLNNNVEKSVFVTYKFLEAKAKLDVNNSYQYLNFSDFINFFDRNEFKFTQANVPNYRIHNVSVSYQNFYDINNDVNGFDTFRYSNPITPENFNFTIDSIKTIESPIKKVEAYYSFKCIGSNSYNDEFKIKKGKGKSTINFHQ